MAPPKFTVLPHPGNGRVPDDDDDELVRVVGGLVDDVQEIKQTQVEHTRALTELSTRVSTMNDILLDFARVGIDEQKIGNEAKRDEIKARQDRRAALWSAFGKGAAFVFSVAGLGLIASIAFKACGHADAAEPPVPAAVDAAVETSEAIEP